MLLFYASDNFRIEEREFVFESAPWYWVLVCFLTQGIQ